MREKNIKALLLRREYPVLKVMLNSMNNVDLASLLENFTKKRIHNFISFNPKRKGSGSIYRNVLFHAGDLDQCLYPDRDQRTLRRHVYG